jgi:hypothetical protein
MIENYRSGLLWQLMRDCPTLPAAYIRRVSMEVGYERRFHYLAGPRTE